MVDSLKKINYKLTGMYRGAVEDNQDPLEAGRIRVRVYPFFVGVEDVEQLPWAVPAMPLFAGAGAGFSSFAVPEEETFVWVFFENGDANSPVYFAEAQTAQYGVPLMALDDYPYSRVLQSKSGILCQIKDKAGEETILVYHPMGSIIEMDKDGNVTVYAHKELDLVAETADVNILATATNINAQAAQSVNVVAGNNVVVQAGNNVAVTAGDDVAVQAGKNITATAGGNASVSAGLAAEVTAGGAVKVTAGGTADVEAALSATVKSDLDVNVIATRDAAVTCGVNADIIAGVKADVTAGVSISLAAPLITLN